jgi:hypothetical protein|uniref:DUF7487 domain-containing protein n=1 Tax=viral metagenome TaxID=1070528 RepID=A0A6C0JP22_9ZZZZ
MLNNKGILTKKRVYNKQLLQELCVRDECIVDFTTIEKYNIQIKIDFTCKCGNKHNKTFRQIYKACGYCKICTESKKKEKVKQTCLERYNVENALTLRKVYNKQFLEELFLRDECSVNFKTIETYNRDIKVDFTCKCGNKHNKTFRQIYKAGGYCKICTESKRKKKVDQTCIKRYNVHNPSQLQEVKDKIKQTCLNNLGVPYPSQSQEVRDKSKQTSLNNFGVPHPLQSQEVRDKIKQTCIKRYNVDNPLQSQEVRDKIKQTCLNNLGVPYPSQSQEVMDKMKQTCFNNLGVSHPSQSQEVRDKSKETCFKNFGVPYPFQSQEVRDKSKQTCLERYNVENPMQDAELSEKASKKSYKLKEFKFICGNTIQVQGYEPFLLDILVKEGYTFEDILTKRTQVPEIWYEKKNNKKSRYYCDIYIPQTNTIYEVKSTWTYKNNIEVNLLKKQACIDAGFNFEFYIFDGKRNRIDENLF